MIQHNLTNENYFDRENAMEYMGYSQFKSFQECPACALAKVKGEYVQEKTQALMMGSYVDAYFSNEMDDFIAKNPEIFKKDGTLKSEYQQCEDIISAIKDDPMMFKYIDGEHQVIMVGEIAGVKFKIKIDALFPGKLIVDQKIVKDMKPIWDEKLHKKVNFVDYWKYSLEGAIYREIYRQNTIDEEHPNGILVPFVLHVTTKEKVPSKALIEIDSETLDMALEEIKLNAPIYDQMKKGLIPAPRCEECDYCKSTAKVTGIKSYHIFDPYQNEEEDFEI